LKYNLPETLSLALDLYFALSKLERMAFVPGYYKTNYRSLRFREVLRMQGNLFKALKAYVLKRFRRPVAAGWMPGLWSDSNANAKSCRSCFGK
jgi:hypothetical protein